MEFLTQYAERISAKWTFRAVLIGLPIIASGFLGELALSADWNRHNNPLGAAIDLVPAVSALVLGTIFCFALPIRARCEGRQVSGIAKILTTASVVFGAWTGASISEIIIVSRNQHHPMLFEETFQFVSSFVSIAVNLFAVIVLTREVIKRCPIQTSEAAPQAQDAQTDQAR